MNRGKTSPEKKFGWLMRLFPAEFRGEYGREMGLMFKDRYREESRRGRRRGIWRLWWDTLLDIFKTAPREHWDLTRKDTLSTLRAMKRSPAFTLSAVVTLALGIGANIGVFSLIDGLLLQSPPYSRNRVRLFGHTAETPFDVLSYPNYADLRDRNRSFAGLAAHRSLQLSLKAGEFPQHVTGELVSGNYFETMEVAPALGRLLNEQDDVNGASPVVVISHGLWQRLYGGGPQALGAEIRLFGKPFYIVGIAPPDFPGSYAVVPTQVWTPLALYRRVRTGDLDLNRRGWGWLSATGRLREGVDLQQAQSEMDVLGARLAAEHPRFNRGMGYRLHPAGSFPESMRSGARRVLGALSLVGGLVLLLVLANLGGVMLTRVLQRRRDTAIRQTLGATRTHLVRLWLTESSLMALLGGLVGLAVAFATREILWTMLASGWGSIQPVLPEFSLRGRTFVFGLIVIALSALALGLIPAWRAGRQALSAMLNEETATASGSRRGARFQAALAVSQIVVSVVFLAASGLLLRSVRHAETFQPGFDTRNLWTATLNLAPHGYDSKRGREFFRRLKRRLESVGGIEAVTFSQVLPLSGERERLSFRIEGDGSDAGGKSTPLDVNLVGPDYFAAMGIPLVEGRDFSVEDSSPGSPLVVIVSEALADRFRPGETALGRWIDQGPNTPQAEVIGVARNIRYQSLGEDPLPIVFGNASQLFSPRMNVHIRAAPGSGFDPRILQRAAASIEPDLAVGTAESFDRVLSAALLPQRILGTATTVFSLLALILTSVGLYALLSYAVQQRCHEFGIRMVMGAQPRDILRLVLNRGLFLAFVGVLLGAGAAIWVGNALAGLLFGVGPADPVSFLVALGLPLMIALMASSLPALRAMRVDPAQSIRRL